MIVADKVSPTSGNHGALDRHAILRDFVSNTPRMNKIVKNDAIPMHADPISTCHAGGSLAGLPHNSFKSGSVVSTAMKVHTPPNNAIRSVFGVRSISWFGRLFRFSIHLSKMAI